MYANSWLFFLCTSILNFICLFITQSFKLLTFFWNSSHLAHLCLMAVLYNVFRGLCHLTTYTFFQITVNIWDNKIINGPAIVTYWENWPLIPTLCFSFLTKHLSMWEPPFLFFRVLILNLLGNTTCHSVSASLQQTIGSFNRNSKGYFSPLDFSPINCMLIACVFMNANDDVCWAYVAGSGTGPCLCCFEMNQIP